ncbi:MAG: NAD-dependent epimerase/dehydratase family protein [Acidimicrobiales bacterium]
MAVLLTGGAGFIGSRTAQALLDRGFACRVVDCLTPYYRPAIKRARLVELQRHPGFEFFELDLRTADLSSILDGVDVVIHLAAQPGVRASWTGFQTYVEHNVIATRRLLEAAKGRVERFVYASSSSVYGDSLSSSTTELEPLEPVSPYGATKLDGERLCRDIAAGEGMATVILRYFTVFGPGQRPDMAMHRLIEAAHRQTAFPLYGTGEQVRDFTYVDDVVNATLLAATNAVPPGSVFNVAGGTPARLVDAIEVIEDLTGRSIRIDRRAVAAGDVKRTSGSTAKIAAALGWRPEYDLVSGLAEQVRWHRRHHRLLAVAA